MRFSFNRRAPDYTVGRRGRPEEAAQRLSELLAAQAAYIAAVRARSKKKPAAAIKRINELFRGAFDRARLDDDKIDTLKALFATRPATENYALFLNTVYLVTSVDFIFDNIAKNKTDMTWPVIAALDALPDEDREKTAADLARAIAGTPEVESSTWYALLRQYTDLNAADEDGQTVLLRIAARRRGNDLLQHARAAIDAGADLMTAIARTRDTISTVMKIPGYDAEHLQWLREKYSALRNVYSDYYGHDYIVDAARTPPAKSRQP